MSEAPRDGDRVGWQWAESPSMRREIREVGALLEVTASMRHIRTVQQVLQCAVRRSGQKLLCGSAGGECWSKAG